MARKSGGNYECPSCKAMDMRVIDSRRTTLSGSYAVRRRRACASCGYRLTTYELAVDFFFPDNQAPPQVSLASADQPLIVVSACGDNIDHSPWAGHAPVSMFDYAVAQEVERQIGDVRALAQAAATVLADWTADCKVDDESIVQLLTAFNVVGCQRMLLTKVENALTNGNRSS